MKLPSSSKLTVGVLLCLNAQDALAFPRHVADVQLVERIPHVEDVFVDGNALVKRKGGGGGGGHGSSGGGGKGGGSSSSSSSGKGGSSSSSSSKGGSSSTSSSSTSNKVSSSSSGKGLGSSSSNTGGSTKTGSGIQPSYGGGRYYGGGAVTPYTAGARSPLAAIVPILLLSSALLFWPGIWLYGAYEYPYTHPYTFYNHTATNTSADGMNQTKPVLCFCGLYAECGCDDNGNTTFLDSLVGDGTYSNLNQSVITVADVNGTSTILINGTLPNGTTTSGGTANANAAGRNAVENWAGYWVMVALVGGMVYAL